MSGTYLSEDQITAGTISPDARPDRDALLITAIESVQRTGIDDAVSAFQIATAVIDGLLECYDLLEPLEPGQRLYTAAIWDVQVGDWRPVGTAGDKAKALGERHAWRTDPRFAEHHEDLRLALLYRDRTLWVIDDVEEPPEPVPSDG